MVVRIGIVLFIIVIAASGIRYRHELKVAAEIATFQNKLDSDKQTQIQKLRSAYQTRTKFLFSLAGQKKMFDFQIRKTSSDLGKVEWSLEIFSENEILNSKNLTKAQKDLFVSLKRLDSIALNEQKDFDYFDRLNSYTNELIVSQILGFRKQGARNSTDKALANISFLFSKEQEIRSLERYDLAIDNARAQLARLSFKNIQDSNRTKSFVFIKTKVHASPHFVIDQVILKTSSR